MVEISIKYHIKLLIISFLLPKFLWKFVWYLYPIGISIHIRFYNNFPPKYIIKKKMFYRVELSIGQFLKFVFNSKIEQNSIFTFIPFQL